MFVNSTKSLHAAGCHTKYLDCNKIAYFPSCRRKVNFQHIYLEFCVVQIREGVPVSKRKVLDY